MREEEQGRLEIEPETDFYSNTLKFWIPDKTLVADYCHLLAAL